MKEIYAPVATVYNVESGCKGFVKMFMMPVEVKASFSNSNKRTLLSKLPNIL